MGVVRGSIPRESSLFCFSTVTHRDLRRLLGRIIILCWHERDVDEAEVFFFFYYRFVYHVIHRYLAVNSLPR